MTNPLTEARNRAGLSQQELATAVGVHPSVISRWENGKNVPTPTYARLVGQALGTDGAILRRKLMEADNAALETAREEGEAR